MLAATVYLTLLGRQGLRQVAELCYHKSHYAAKRIAEIPGYRPWSVEPFFNEFVVECPLPAKDVLDHLLEHNILGGHNLGQDYQELSHHILMAVTEMNTKDEIETLIDVLTEARHG